jgi:hypothetical protein
MPNVMLLTPSLNAYSHLDRRAIRKLACRVSPRTRDRYQGLDNGRGGFCAYVFTGQPKADRLPTHADEITDFTKGNTVLG